MSDEKDKKQVEEGQTTDPKVDEDGMTSEGRRLAYHRTYYERNKERIKAQKKKLYANDPEYKANWERSKKKRSIKSRQKKALEKLARNGEPKKRVAKVKTMVSKNGLSVKCKMYTRSQFAEEIGLSQKTLEKWEYEGIMPEATFRTEKGWRFFSEEQVMATIEVYEKHCPEEKSKWRITDEFISDLSAAWEKTGH